MLNKSLIMSYTSAPRCWLPGDTSGTCLCDSTVYLAVWISPKGFPKITVTGLKNEDGQGPNPQYTALQPLPLITALWQSEGGSTSHAVRAKCGWTFSHLSPRGPSLLFPMPPTLEGCPAPQHLCLPAAPRAVLWQKQSQQSRSVSFEVTLAPLLCWY